MQQILAFLQSKQVPLPPVSGAPGLSQAQIQQLVSILNLLSGNAQTPGVLGQVNGALGQTIGNLLDGKKSAIGIIGAMLTAILQHTGPSMPLSSIISSLPSTAGLGDVAMPAFLAMTAWGVLGKLEKWTQSAPPQ